MADEVKILKWNSSLKDDDNENKSSPASTEIPMDDTPMKSEDQKNDSADDILPKVKKISMLSKLLNDDDQNNSSSSTEKPTDDIPAKVKSELSKLLNDDDQKNISSSSSSEKPMDDIPAKVNTTEVKSELSKLLNDDDEKNISSSEVPILMDDTPSKANPILSDGATVNANKEKPMLEMDDIPLKVKMAAEAKKKSEIDNDNDMPHHLPFKTEYPRSYGYGQLSATIVSESRLKPVLGEFHVESSSEKADREDDGGNVSGG